MGWLAKIFGAVKKEELVGAHFNYMQPHWEVDGPKDFPSLFRALDGWLSEQCILYFEGGSPDSEINNFMKANSIPEQTHIEMGTIWPRPKMFHVPGTHAILKALAEIMEHHAEPELAVHFHVYRQGVVLLEWHDAFSQPMLITSDISEDNVRKLADRMGTKYKRIVEQ